MDASIGSPDNTSGAASATTMAKLTPRCAAANMGLQHPPNCQRTWYSHELDWSFFGWERPNAAKIKLASFITGCQIKYTDFY
jgi:hypothetical protein